MILTLKENGSTVHLVKEVKCERGTRKANTKCGLVIVDDANAMATEWTVWNNRVTCDACKA